MYKIRRSEKGFELFDGFNFYDRITIGKTSWEIIKLLKIYGEDKAVEKTMELFKIDRNNATEDIKTILNNLDLLKIKLEEIPIKISTEKYAPRRVQIDVTPRCNQKCIYCLSSDLISHETEIPKEKIIDVMGKLYKKGMWILVISGGEPLIREDIFDIINYTDKLDVVTWLYTNATLIDEKAAKKLADYKKLFIQISLDSSNPKNHDIQRGVKGAFEKTVNGIKNLIKNNIIPTIAITVTQINFDDIENTTDFLHNLGIKQVRMAPARLTYGRGEINKEKINLNFEKIKLLGKKISELNRKYTGKINFSVSPNMFDYPTNPELIKSLEVGCEAGRDIIYISSNGDIYPCYSLCFPVFKGGNILIDDVIKVWENSKVFNDFRKLKISNLKKCSKCPMLDKCAGGCRGNAYGEFQDLTAPDPVYCSFFLDKNYLKTID